MSWMTALAAVVALLALPTGAVAGADCDGPTGDQYCPKTEVVTDLGSGGDPGDPSAEDPGGLPFTGYDIALGLAAATALIGAGAVLRQAARGRGDA